MSEASKERNRQWYARQRALDTTWYRRQLEEKKEQRKHLTPEQRARKNQKERERRQRPEVKARVREQMRERRARPGSREREKRYARNGLLKLWGMSAAEFDALSDSQSGCCAICGQPETAAAHGGGTRPLSIDHDHETGQIRGLLCTRCNQGLGLFGDDEATLLAAVGYLRTYRVRAVGGVPV